MKTAEFIPALESPLSQFKKIEVFIHPESESVAISFHYANPKGRIERYLISMNLKDSK